MISYKDWMDGTKRGILTPRSSQLKAIDTALKAYEDQGRTIASLKAVAEKLRVWIQFKGGGDKWRQSTRNSNGTVARLYNDLAQALGPAFAIAMAGGLGGTRHLAPSRPIRRRPHPNLKLANLGAVSGFGVGGGESAHRAQVLEAYARLSGLAEQCRDAMLKVGKDEQERDRYERWFGAYDVAQVRRVLGVFQRMYNAMTDGGVTVTIDTVSDPSWYAYVRPGEGAPLKIYLCKQFFTGMSGPLASRYQRSSDATVVTMLHECTHIRWIGTHIDGDGIRQDVTDVRYNGEVMYGVDNCELLATDRPDLAEFNADNYAFYGLSLISAV
jgi:hypothetical protein